MAVLPLGMKAQGTDNELETDFGARLNVTADAKIKKGFHWTVEAEARMRENFSELGRLQAGTGFTYKLKAFSFVSLLVYLEGDCKYLSKCKNTTKRYFFKSRQKFVNLSDYAEQ